MDLPSRVGPSGFFFFFFFFLVAKITLKTQNFWKNLTFFAEKFWENIFLKFSAKTFRFSSKNSWFYKIFEKKKKSAKTENLSLSCP